MRSRLDGAPCARAQPPGRVEAPGCYHTRFRVWLYAGSMVPGMMRNGYMLFELVFSHFFSRARTARRETPQHHAGSACSGTQSAFGAVQDPCRPAHTTVNSRGCSQPWRPRPPQSVLTRQDKAPTQDPRTHIARRPPRPPPRARMRGSASGMRWPCPHQIRPVLRPRP